MHKYPKLFQDLTVPESPKSKQTSRPLKVYSKLIDQKYPEFLMEGDICKLFTIQ
jgi:hypothetical protein